jgi:ribosomal protein S27AE
MPRGILLAELTRRNLRFDNQLIEEPLDDLDSGPVDPAPDENIDGYSEYELLQLGGVVLSECETTEQAELICFALDRATISSATRQRNSSGDLRWPQVLVAPDDLERAREIVAGGISAELREEFESLPVEVDFQNPACPHCGSLDALLESVDPMNRWLCGDCGSRWQDPLPE